MLDFILRADPPSELIPGPCRLQVQIANAPLLCKSIDQAFAQLFAPRKTNRTDGAHGLRENAPRSIDYRIDALPE